MQWQRIWFFNRRIPEPTPWHLNESVIAVVMSILLYGCMTWTVIKYIEKKLDYNCIRMLQALINNSLKQHHTKQQPYSHLPPISKTIQIKRTRHAGHCCRSKDELISNIPPWTPSHGWASVGWPARIYLQLLCADIGCSLEDLPKARDDRDEYWGRVGKSMLEARHDDDLTHLTNHLRKRSKTCQALLVKLRQTHKWHSPMDSYTRMLHAVLNKSWKQHPTKVQLLTFHLTNHPSKTNKTCWALLVVCGLLLRHTSLLANQLCVEDLPSVMINKQMDW